MTDEFFFLDSERSDETINNDVYFFIFLKQIFDHTELWRSCDVDMVSIGS